MAVPVPVAHSPRIVRDTADDFKDFMSSTEYRSFVAVLCAAVFGICGYSDVNRYMLFANSVSSIANFFNSDALWPKLNRRHRRRILRLLKHIDNDPKRYMWVIDDTLLPHFGSKIWGAYWWKDHCNGGTTLGHKLLVLGVLDRKNKLLIPVFWEVLHRDLTELTDEDIPQVHEKGWQVALRLLAEAELMGFPKLVLTGDTWFACEEFFDALNMLGTQYEFEIKSNRKIVEHKGRTFNKSAEEFFADRYRSGVYTGRTVKYAAEATVRFKDSKRKHKVIGVANRKANTDIFAYYISNVLTWNASKIWGLARDRWGIEVQFRDLKQLFTLGKAAVQSRNAVETAISVAAIALTVIRLQQFDEADTEGNGWTRPRSAGAIIQQMSIESMRQLVTEITANIRKNDVLERLKKRLSYENLIGKPAEFRRKPVMAPA